MQKHNEWVDNVKDEWAAIRGIPLYRIWEHDIHKNPGKVMKLLKESIMHLEKQDYWKQRH